MRIRRRLLSLMLCVSMVFSMCPQAAAAEGAGDGSMSTVEGGLCGHHPAHTADCGYAEGSEGTPCTHEHTEDCYTLVTNCVHEHTAECYPAGGVSAGDAELSGTENTEPTACTHECSEENGCIKKELNCQHTHDESCGYALAVKGSPCRYVCEICQGESASEEGASGEDTPEEGKEETPVCICTEKCAEDSVNAECPVCGAEGADLSQCAGEDGAEEAVCTCTTLCTEDNVNTECPVCGAEDADLSQCAGTEQEQDEAVEHVQALIDALPALSDMENMGDDEREAAIVQYTEAYEAYDALTDEQKLQITGAEVLEEFMALMDDGVALAGETGAFTVTGGTYGTDYSYASGVLTILTGTPLTISNTDSGTAASDRIVIRSGISAVITLGGINISSSFSPIDIPSGASADITLAPGSTNTVTANGAGEAGIHVPSSASLTIRCGAHADGSACGGGDGCGTLSATGRKAYCYYDRYNSPLGCGGGAGIGGDGGIEGAAGEAAGSIIIRGGKVTATGSASASARKNSAGGSAGIGGGGGGYYSYQRDGGSGGAVTITGGSVSATGTCGIGGGDGSHDYTYHIYGKNGDGGTIVMTGGTLNGVSTSPSGSFSFSDATMTGCNIQNSTVNVTSGTIINSTVKNINVWEDKDCTVSGSTLYFKDATTTLTKGGEGNTYNGAVSLINGVSFSGNTTFNGNVTVETEVAFPESVTTIGGDLTVNSTAEFQKDLTVKGKTIVSENGSLIIGGSATFSGDVTCSAELIIPGDAVFDGNTVLNKAVSVAGDAIFNGATTLSNTIDIEGTATFKNTLSLGEEGKLGLKGDSYILNNVTSAGSITVADEKNLYIYGDISNSGTIAAAGNVYCSGVLQGEGNDSVIRCSCLDAKGNPLVSNALPITTELLSLTGNTLKDGWYVVDQSTSLSSQLNISGNVRLILADRASLSAGNGITVSSGSSLTLYKQSAGDFSGSLTVTGTFGGNGGNVVFNGLTVSNNEAQDPDVLVAGGTITGNAGLNESAIDNCQITGNAAFSGESVISGEVIVVNGSLTNTGNLTIMEGLSLRIQGDMTNQKDCNVTIQQDAELRVVGTLHNEGTVSGDGLVNAVYLTGNGTILASTSKQRVVYLDENGVEQSAEAIPVNKQRLMDENYKLTAGWYYFSEDFTISASESGSGITLSGDVKFILADGVEVKIDRGIKVNDDGCLYTYAQSREAESMGRLTVSCIKGRGAITGAAVVINGGYIKATGGAMSSAGIDCKSITINAGIVEAKGNYTGADIGATYGGAGTIVINGGIVYGNRSRAGDTGNTNSIGAGHDSNGGNFSTGTSGGAIIYVGDGWIFDKVENSNWDCIVFHESSIHTTPNTRPNGSVSGNPVLRTDHTFDSNKTLKIQNGESVTIAAGTTITNNGTIIIEEGGKLIVEGTLINNGTIKNSGTFTNNGTVTHGTLEGNMSGSLRSYSSKTAVSVSMDSGNTTETVTEAAYGSGIAINVTVTPGKENLISEGDNVSIYLGNAKTGTPLGTAQLSVSGTSYTASLGVTLDGENWNADKYTITAVFNGVASTAEKEGLLSSSGSTALTVKAASLPQPEVTWDGATASWNKVEHASGYEAALYQAGQEGKEGKLLHSDTVEAAETEQTYAYEFTKYITGAGTYYVTVKALGTGNYADGEAKTSDPVTYYTVTVGSSTGGEANASASFAKKDTTITLEITEVAEGYGFWKWESSPALADEPAKTGAGQWIFSMSAADITITPVFEKIPAAPGVSVVTEDGSTYQSGTWTKQSVTITVSGKAEGSGVGCIQYSVDDGATWEAIQPENTSTGDAGVYQGTLSVSSDKTKTAAYRFRMVTEAGTEGADSEAVTVKWDRSAPTAAINIRHDVWNNNWDQFWNWVSFGAFFNDKKETRVTVTPTDTESGIASVEYLISDTPFTQETAVSGSWSNLPEADGVYSFSLEPNRKGAVYVRVTDNAGNTAVINSAGIVVYTDAARTGTETLTFTKLSGEDIPFYVSLNGNTVRSITLQVDGAEDTTLQADKDYDVDYNTGRITLKAAYLQDLAAGTYTLKVDYNPMGVEYTEKAEGDAPASTGISLEVKKAAGTVTITNLEELNEKIYDGKAVSAAYETSNKNGAVTIEYKPSGEEDTAYTTSAPKNAGTYTVRVTVGADAAGNYGQASVTESFTIAPRELTVSSCRYRINSIMV